MTRNVILVLKAIFYLSILGQLMTGCAETKDTYSMDDFFNVEKIDAHLHANTAGDALLEQAATDNFKVISVNVDYPDFPPIEEQLAVAVELRRRHPDRFAFAGTFRMDGWDSPDWQKKVMTHLDNCIESGAVAVKVWKNIGMSFRDQNGNLVMIDDPGFDPVFAHLQQAETPVIGHLGEPKNCWLPLEEMTVNNDKSYFKAHPQYHMYLHPEFPSYEEQVAARDRMLDKNRKMVFMGAHLATLEWDVEVLAKFLRKYPNTVVDFAHRIGHVQYQSQRNYQKVRQFMIEFQDRVLYATDQTYAADANDAEFKKSAHEIWLKDWRYFCTDEMMTAPEVNGEFQGLALPKQVIDKLYRRNAERTFPRAFE